MKMTCTEFPLTMNSARRSGFYEEIEAGMYSHGAVVNLTRLPGRRQRR